MCVPRMHADQPACVSPAQPMYPSQACKLTCTCVPCPINALSAGMLTIMSVAPIISVLLTSLLRKPVKRAAVELARLSKMSLSRMSRRSNTYVVCRGFLVLQILIVLLRLNSCGAGAAVEDVHVAHLPPVKHIRGLQVSLSLKMFLSRGYSFVALARLSKMSLSRVSRCSNTYVVCRGVLL